MPSSTAEILKNERIDEVVEAARRLIGHRGAAGAADQPEVVEEFVRRCFETIAPDDILAREPEDLAAAALCLWRFGDEREVGTPKVRIYDPSDEENRWDSPHTVVEVINDDMPFLVDSVTAALNGRNHSVQLMLHPVVRTVRDEGGERRPRPPAPAAPETTKPAGKAKTSEKQTKASRKTKVAALAEAAETDPAGGAPAGEVRESYIQVEIERVLGGVGERREIVEALELVLRDVRAAVDDWRPMRGKVAEILDRLTDTPPPRMPPEEIEEAASFLRWLDDNHFTFLGYRELELVEKEDGDYLRLIPGSSLGVLRVRERPDDRKLRPLTPKMSRFARKPQLLFVTKANHRSTVHRPSYMDYVGVKRFDDEGRVVGEQRFLGLFTSMAYNRQARSIPLLRRKVENVLRRAGFPADSHDGKALVHILETFPRDELFQISERRLFEMVMGILQLQERQRIALFVRRDPFERFVSCLVYAPRDRYNTELRLGMQAILETALNGTVTAYYTQVSDSPLARVHYVVETTPGKIPEFDVKTIEASLAEAARTWADALYEVLIGERPDDPRAKLFQRYQEAFPTVYRERFKAREAVEDIRVVEQVLADGRLGMRLYHPELATDPNEVRFKIYHPDAPVALSDVLPLLENMGLGVGSEIPHEVRPAGADRAVWIHDFGIRSRTGEPLDLERLDPILPEAFARVWTGEVENDGFNRLVVRAGLAWYEVVVLRAYAKFLRQAGSAFSESYMQETLASRPALARLLIELFDTRFDPDRREGVEERMEEIQERVREALEEVTSLDEDRILRRFRNLIRATLRTNYFQRRDDGERKSYLSLKLESSGLKILPKPRPRFEIFVYSPRVEAVHLRGGEVARGGIRWSDRREDFRTEVLGLVKAQMVKNAVIVPVGAKGGFVVKRPPAEREALLAEGQECYRTMIRGMLDITDNLVEGEVVPPPRVVRMDGDDTYLVVAADKGTATFSDLANAVAAEYGFWLDDAFASGGTHGYDHKAMGITARGAWEAVKRHFRELGTDIQNEDFTVVGVGDMSGDVFGNGMLLSEHIRLVGAFNHLHVFVDPDPDPAISYAERQRLFALPRSTWADYDAEKLSAGGRVYDRAAKSIELTPEIRELLGIKPETVTPNRLVQALLKAKVDLLWFGGIGTFVKASDESNTAADDRANDAVRVDGSALRCKVIGEGANLGVTQAGRIEFALGGGKINTDAIDNSGGVDTSDHEVNIKILLGEEMARGRLDLEERDRLLGAMTEEVAGLVLRHNYLQTQAISMTAARSPYLLDSHVRMMRYLERADRLDRALESLPDDDTIAEREAQQRGLTRPEIAVLLAYGKIFLYEQLLDSTLPDDPLLADDLVLYFPRPLRKKYREAIEGHRLRREIIATYVTNSMVNRVGPAFVTDLAEETGRGAADVARAYTVTREGYDLRRLWASIEALDSEIPAKVQIEMILAVGRLVERVTAWFLRNGGETLDVTAINRDFRPAVAALAESLPEVLPRTELAAQRRRGEALVREGVPEELAASVAALADLAAAPDIWRIARRGEWQVEEVGRLYFQLGNRFRLDWLRNLAGRLSADGRWQKAAVSAVVDSLFLHQTDLTRQVLDVVGVDGSAKKAIDEWVATKPGAVRRTEGMLRELKAAKSVDLAMLMVADDHVRRLVTE